MKNNCIKEALFALSNVFAGTKEQVQMLLDMNLIADIVKYLMVRFNLKKSATISLFFWILCYFLLIAKASFGLEVTTDNVTYNICAHF